MAAHKSAPGRTFSHLRVSTKMRGRLKQTGLGARVPSTRLALGLRAR